MGRPWALAFALVMATACGGGGRDLPAFALTDQWSRPVRADDLRGQALIVSFIFTTCVEACPLITAQLVRVQAAARQAGLTRIHLVSISIDPLTDTPERLRAYAAAYGADLDSWSFLTGSPEEVARLMRALEVTTAPGQRGLAHDAPILFVDPRGRIRERQDAVALAPDRAVETLRKLAS
jgi:protein SCO1/2